MAVTRLGIAIDVDISDLSGTINELKLLLGPDKFNSRMAGILRRTGAHVGTILMKVLPKEYYVGGGKIRKAIGPVRMSDVAGDVGCSIPIRGTRGSIGGSFSARGGAHGWASKRRKYRITAKVVKAEDSTLPSVMSSYGGYPPFRNLSFGGVTFTRETKERLPIRNVVGIAIPQMPMNRSREEVQDEIRKYIQERLAHEIERAISK